MTTIINLLSKKAQRALMDKKLTEILDPVFITSCESLTNFDKKKLTAVREFVEIYNANVFVGEHIKSTTDAASYCKNWLQHENVEKLGVLFLDTKNKIIASEVITVGTLNSSIAHPREIFRAALKYPTAQIIVTHNHPSGDPYPSEADIATTKRLVHCGHLMGINVLDHIIVGTDGHYSLREIRDDLWHV